MKENALNSLSKITKFFLDSGDLTSEDKDIRNSSRGTLTMAYRKYHRPKPEERRSNGYHSQYGTWTNSALEFFDEAIKEEKSGAGIHPNLRAEHAVPINQIIKHFINLSEKPDIEYIKNFLNENLVIIIVTKEEDALFRKAGLNSKMPQDWDGTDVWARYRMVGLYENLNFFKANEE